MSDFGFTKQPTPGEGVREFYRRQGEARESERIIKLLKERLTCCDGYKCERWGEVEGCCVTDNTQTQMSPNAHTADLVTRARYRAEGRINERESITNQLKALPAGALFYPANILKILKLH